MDNKVFAIRCSNYEEAEERLSLLIERMGGMGSFVSAGERIILKVNLLRPARPEEAVTPHPEVVKGVGKLVKDSGALPAIADSPGSGYPYTVNILRRAYRKSGMNAVSSEIGCVLNLDTDWEVVSFPEGELIKRFEIIKPVLQADGLINICKLKTHEFMGLTGAVKNLFGVVPGLAKPGYHAKLHDPDLFAGMLLDLAEFILPALSVMDTVVAMEGHGPGSGDPRHVGFLLASTNPLALDVVAGEIIGLPYENNPLLKEAEKRGLSPTRLKDVDLVGANPSELKVPNFKLPSSFAPGSGLGQSPWLRRLLENLLKNSMSVKPEIQKETCTACGICATACPMEAITMENRSYARIDHGECIRCYCCHEMCPEKAIELKHGFLYRKIIGDK
ncbi:MAG: 4Fe-4S ferredoxin [Spirochaetes bacterium]|mgnify:CR=1 FL=1|nr:MAG: 4Fe-4S ferredoxin [Spirochaetota bacterium]